MSQSVEEGIEANNLYWLGHYCRSLADTLADLCADAPQFHILWELRADGIDAIDRALNNTIRVLPADLRAKLLRLMVLLSELPPSFISEALSSREQCVRALQDDAWKRVAAVAVPLAPELSILSGFSDPSNPHDADARTS